MLKRVFGCALFLFAVAALAQWTRGPQNPDGAWLCTRTTGEKFETGYVSPSYSTAICNALVKVEAWLGGTLPEAKAQVLIAGGAIPPGPAASAWTVQMYGDAGGSILEISSTQLNFSVESTNDTANKATAYQSIGSGDAQVKCVVEPVANWDGYTETWTFFGCQIRDANGKYVSMARPAVGSGVGVCKVDDDDATPLLLSTGGSTGQFGPYLYAVTYDASATTVKCFESLDGGSGWVEVGSFVTTLAYPLRAGPWGSSHENGNTTQVVTTGNVVSGTIDVYTPSDPGGGDPACSGMPPVQWTQGTAIGSYSIASYCSDPQMQAMTFSVAGLPGSTGISMSSAGVFSGTPNANDLAASPFIVTVTATDTDTNTGEDDFTVTIAAASGDAFLIPTTQTTVDCTAAQPLQGGGTATPGPGDTIILDGTARGIIIIESCIGSPTSFITIRNDATETGQLVVSYSGSGFQSRCMFCQYVDITSVAYSGAPAGTLGVTVSGGAWTEGRTQAGIKFSCTSGSPHSAFRFGGSSKQVKFRNIEIDGNRATCGTPNIGLSINDGVYLLTDNPSAWREGIVLENNYIHEASSESIYFGPNYHEPQEIPQRNNDIRFNIIEDGGWDCVNVKSVFGTPNTRIYQNLIQNCGLAATGGGNSGVGIAIIYGANVDVYLNRIRDTNNPSLGSRRGILVDSNNVPTSVLATTASQVYGNDVYDTGGEGIVARATSGQTAHTTTIYANTVVQTGAEGIECGSSMASGVIRDNIVAGETVNASPCTSSNNDTGSVASQNFVNAGAQDFRLTASSPARNNGGATCPSTDLLNLSRPQGVACDRGAYEFDE
jgi:hypothetical protein